MDAPQSRPAKQWVACSKQKREVMQTVASPEGHLVGTKQADLEIAVRHDSQPVAVCGRTMARREGLIMARLTVARCRGRGWEQVPAGCLLQRPQPPN